MGFDSSGLGSLVNAFAPYVYLHPDEEWFPSSAEWYMDQVNYVEASGRTFSPNQWSFDGSVGTKVPGAAGDYMQIPGDNGYTTDPPAAAQQIRIGNPSTATAYVHVLPVYGTADQIDLQYWLFYPFNGAEYLYFDSPAGSSGSTDLDLSFHQGDWECVTVRIGDNGNIVGVRLSQHSGSEWFSQSGSGDDGDYQVVNGTQPVVYVARGSHANYPAAGGPYYIGGVNKFGWQLAVGDYTGQGRAIDYSKSSTIIKDDTALFAQSSVPAPPVWLGFEGRWGAPAQTQFTTAGVIRAIVAALRGLRGEAVVLFALLQILTGPVLPIAFVGFAGALIAVLVKAGQEGPYNPPVQGGWDDMSGPEPWPGPVYLEANGAPLAIFGAPALLPATAASDPALYYKSGGGALFMLDLSTLSETPLITLSSADGMSGVVLTPPVQGTTAPITAMLLANPPGDMNVYSVVPGGYPVSLSAFVAAAANIGALAVLATGTSGATGATTLVCAYPGPASNGASPLMVTTASGPAFTQWTLPVNAAGEQIPHVDGVSAPPAAAVLDDGTLAIVYVNTLQAGPAPLYGLSCITTTDLTTWQGPYDLELGLDATQPSTSLASPPALASDGTLLSCVSIDGNGQLRLMQSTNGSAWSYPIAVPGAAAVAGSPAIAVNAQAMWLLAADSGTGQAMLWSVMRPLRPWLPWTNPNTSKRVAQPAWITAVFHDPGNSTDLDLFATDGQTSAEVWAITRTSGVWGFWNPVPGVGTNQGALVTAVYTDPANVDVFVADRDGSVWTTAGAPSTWPASPQWTQIGPPQRMQYGAPVTALYRAQSEQLDLYSSDGNGHVFTATRTAGVWGSWVAIAPNGHSTVAGSVVTAVYPTPATVELFMTDGDGSVWTIATAIGRWPADWSPVNANKQLVAGAPITAVYRDAAQTQLDLYGSDGDGKVYTTTSISGGAWQPWTAVPNQDAFSLHTGSPRPVCAIVRDDTHWELFAISGSDGTVWTIAWDRDAGWGPWSNLSPSICSTTDGLLTAISGTSEELFMAGTDGTVWTTSSPN